MEYGVRSKEYGVMASRFWLVAHYLTLKQELPSNNNHILKGLILLQK